MHRAGPAARAPENIFRHPSRVLAGHVVRDDASNVSTGQGAQVQNVASL